MRRALTYIAAIAIGLTATAGAEVATAAATTRPGSTTTTTTTTTTPSPARTQLERDVSNAEHSTYLWATVNICVSRAGHGGLFGVRGQMPALPVASTLSMTFKLSEYSTADKRFIPVSGATASRTVSLGSHDSKLHQGGVEFPYRASAGRLDATVTFAWRRGRDVLGQVSRVTTGGHPSAKFGRPAGHSAASCML